MTRESLRAGGITESTVSDALMACRGDLFVTASYLGCTARELDGYIRASEGLQVIAGAIGSLKVNNADYKRLSDEQFSDELERLTRGYRIEALEVIHELAVESALEMSAAEKEVKLKAALALRGAPEARTAVNEQSQVLEELNRLYQENAPRIKTVRAVQIEYQN